MMTACVGRGRDRGVVRARAWSAAARRPCAWALYRDKAATLDDLREAVTALEDSERIARRVFGGAHPITVDIGITLQRARTALRARETSA